MLKKLPSLTVIEAPAGYGKTSFARKLCADFPNFPLLEYNYPGTGGEIFFDNLSRLCTDAHVPFAYTREIFDWYRAWNSATIPFILFLDDFPQLKPEERVRNFLIYLLKNPLNKLHLIISTPTPLNLPIQELIASGAGKYLELNDLNLSLEEMKKIWQKEELNWETEDEDTFYYFSGWPGGIALYRRYRKKEISRTVYAKILQDYISQAIAPLNKRISENHTLRQEKQILAEVAKLPKVISDRLTTQLKKDPEYWIYLANEDKQTPEQSVLLLQRAIALTETQGNNQLNVLTRMAHNYSLLAEFRKLDATLIKGEKYRDNAPVVDNFAWLYLKANRLRQLCHYQESQKLLNELISQTATGQASLNFQTRARVLLGLSEYQQGNYEQTRKYYHQAMLLAKAEFNETLILELQIMSAFLEVWEGREPVNLPENIAEIIKKQTPKNQPLMWLNLAFFWILGEQIDLNLTREIISKIKDLSIALGWNYLKPLIADVEARLKRYAGEYEQASLLHQEAISELEPDTFEYYHALLNQALTMRKQGKKEAANELLQEIRKQTEKNGSLGLCREAIILLGEKENNLPPKIPVSANSPQITVNLFGGFKVKIGEQLINKWPRKKSRNLLADLILNPRGLHRESLADRIFSAESVDNPLKNLDVSIHSLRKALEPERKSKESSFILFSDSCYSFNWSSSHSIDTFLFEQFYQDWQKENTDENAEKVLNLYQGELLPEIEFAENWQEERAAFQRKAISLFTWLTESKIKNKNYSQAEHYAEKLVALDNLNEDAHLLLMKVAGLKGDKILLNQLYRNLENILKKELDCQPAMESQKQYARLLEKLREEK